MSMLAFALGGAVVVTVANLVGGPDFGVAYTTGFVTGAIMGATYALTRAREIARETVKRAFEKYAQQAERDKTCPHGMHFNGHWCEECNDG